MTHTVLTIELRSEHDVVFTRQRARQVAEGLGFDGHDQTRLATAASEVARNAFAHGGGGRVEISVDDVDNAFVIQVTDKTSNVRDLQQALDGRPSHPASAALIGAKRLVDELELKPAPTGAGVAVVLRQFFLKGTPAPTARKIGAVTQALVQQGPRDALEEVRHQNEELLRALEELRARNVEVERLNRELEDTNRGVLALYAELDDKALDLKRASDLKSRFLSNMTHELRTPLNSIIMLSRLLLDGSEGELTPNQRRPITLMQRSADQLLELVNDLLDLAKIEAGKTEVKPAECHLVDVFAALRGIFRPLQGQHTAELIFDDPEDLPPLYTDEGKLSQILRNFISNAMKFTKQGHVLVRAERRDPLVTVSVEDTGVGIAPEDLRRLFQEFEQLDEGETRHKGTGLGLSLSKRLAELIGGTVSVTSTRGQGSTFYVTIPIRYASPGEVGREAQHA